MKDKGAMQDNTTEISQAEFQALCLSVDKTRLKKRLNEARSLLQLRYRKMFKPGIFKPAEKALYSDFPFGYKLQWQTRRNPSEPEGYDNQQTLSGAVYLELAMPVDGEITNEANKPKDKGANKQ